MWSQESTFYAACWFFLSCLACVCEAASNIETLVFPFAWLGALWHLAAGPWGPPLAASGPVACLHTPHPSAYEQLSETWWLSSEVRTGNCRHLGGQRWDWLRDGETQRASLTWLLPRLDPPDRPERIISLQPSSQCWPNSDTFGNDITADEKEMSPFQAAELSPVLQIYPYKAHRQGRRCLSAAKMPFSFLPLYGCRSRWLIPELCSCGESRVFPSGDCPVIS